MTPNLEWGQARDAAYVDRTMVVKYPPAVRTLGELHAAAQTGENREGALGRLTEEWDPVEKLDFQQWLRYYERGDHEKYAAVGHRAGACRADAAGSGGAGRRPTGRRPQG